MLKMQRCSFLLQKLDIFMSSESFINNVPSPHKPSSYLPENTFLLSHWILKKWEKWLAVKRKKKNNHKPLPSALLWLITWEAYFDMFTRQWLHLGAKIIFWVAASRCMKSVKLAVMSSWFCVENLKLYCTGGVMSGEYELWLQECTAVEELHGPMQCVQENGISLGRHLTVWDSLQLAS